MDERLRTMEQLEQAREKAAGLAAPTTELGLIVPAHVLEERAQEAYLPNRAQRRARERVERRQARRLARSTPEQADAIREFEAAAARLTGDERARAAALLKSIRGLPRAEQLAAIERFGETA